MSYDAAIRVCRAYDSDLLLGPVRGTGDMFELRGLSMLARETAPVVVDHDHSLVVGEIRELTTWEFTDGRWIVARARLETPPGWLKQGTPASFSYRALQTSEINGWRIISRALIDEVTVCSATHRAVDPLAHVAVLKRAPHAAPATPDPHGLVIWGDGRSLHRPGQIIGVR